MPTNIETLGFSCEHWKGVFYPPAGNERRWLVFDAEQFDTLEINSSFYRLPRVIRRNSLRA